MKNENFKFQIFGGGHAVATFLFNLKFSFCNLQFSIFNLHFLSLCLVCPP